MNVRCPNLPGWGNWGPWSTCIPNEPEIRDSLGRCQSGTRVRHRKCDNPPSESPPLGVPCSGSSEQTAECRYKCDNKPFNDPANVKKQIDLRVEQDHRTGLKFFKQVQRRKVGERTTMSCDTPAYRLAKRLTVISEFNATRQGLQTEQPQITWFKNGHPVEPTGPISRVSSPFVRVASSYLLNEFRLKVDSTRNKLWLAAEYPASMRLLRHVSVTCGLLCELFLLVLLLTIWANSRRLERTLSTEQKSLIVQEMVDNGTRLILTARRRAMIHRLRLLPLIIRESIHLRQAHDHLMDKLVNQDDDTEEEPDDEADNEGFLQRISIFRRSTVSKSFKRQSSIFRRSRKQNYSVVSTDSGMFNITTAQRTSKLKKLFGLERSKAEIKYDEPPSPAEMVKGKYDKLWSNEVSRPDNNDTSCFTVSSYADLEA
ncbi:hypothetical protein AHF37_07807 [Paragonimus kellicotti]|nr:hypothetical protein AHF37_07807 [Paragonimus kellicotti]